MKIEPGKVTFTMEDEISQSLNYLFINARDYKKNRQQKKEFKRVMDNFKRMKKYEKDK